MRLVTKSAVVNRINRKLAQSEEKLCGRQGSFFIKNLRFNTVEQEGIDVALLARELGVLRGNEEVQA